MCIFDIFVKVAVGVGLCLSPLSCPTDLSICVCAMLFVLLWLCSIWDQEWLPTLVFFCAGLSGLSCLVCLHTKFKNFFFLDLLRKVWYLAGTVLNLEITFGRMAIFHYINPANSWPWENFPPSGVFLLFFLQYLKSFRCRGLSSPLWDLFPGVVCVCVFVTVVSGIVSSTLLQYIWHWMEEGYWFLC